jgi:threonine/homoserine/homoserine lactone efflux protein|tara:strand:+ start:5880 stop:6503 length:624 start_codon:yes stop_codon:yes gene_type:complete
MYWTEFFTIAIAHLFAVASPGPDFAVVLKQCVTSGTRSGIWTSLGVGAAILLHVTYCIFGVALLLTQSPLLFLAVRYLAAIYLLYLGVAAIKESMKIKGAEIEISSALEIKPVKAFYLGFLTNGLNPKATLFFLSLFTVAISPATPTFVQAGYGLYLAVATFAWFTMLSVVLGREKFRSRILKLGVWFERIMGIILIFLAVQIVLFV